MSEKVSVTEMKTRWGKNGVSAQRKCATRTAFMKSGFTLLPTFSAAGV